MFGRSCSEWMRGGTCLKHWVNWPKKPTMREDGEKTTSFFRRMVPIRTNSKLNAFVKTRTHGKNGTTWTYEPTCHKLKSTPLQHFVHLQQNAMWISPRVAITAVTLFTPPKHPQVVSLQGVCVVSCVFFNKKDLSSVPSSGAAGASRVVTVACGKWGSFCYEINGVMKMDGTAVYLLVCFRTLYLPTFGYRQAIYR